MTGGTGSIKWKDLEEEEPHCQGSNVCVCVVFLMEFILSIMLRWSVGPPHSRPIISPEKGHLPPGHGGYRSQESQDGHHDSGGEVS